MDLNLIKWIIFSNQSLNQLKIPYLRNIISPDLRIPSYYSFRKNILPEVMAKLHEAIETKLNNAVTISLIVDTWTNTVGSEFLALSAITTNEALEKEFMVIGFLVLQNGHSAERIKEAIETIINKYNFDKSKISCMYIFVISKVLA